MSAWWNALHFLRPHWLWALLALPLWWGLWRLRQRQQHAWRDVVDAHLLPHLLETAGKTTLSAVWMAALGYLLAVLALAGPSWRQGEQPLWQSQTPLVIAFDLSSSMTAPDLPPSRLLQARSKIATLLRDRAGGQVGLVAYAGEAFTVAPLTDDAANVALFLDALEPAVMPVDGQQADKAIAWSVRLLQQAGFERGDILIMADHADAGALAAAAAASRQGFRVAVLGVGTLAGAPYRDAEGRILQARLQPASLAALGTAGGGGYQPLSAGEGDLQALGVLDPAQAGRAAQRGEQGLAWLDEGYWLLPPLMLLALFAFRRGGALAAILLCLSMPLAMPAHAAEGSLWQRADQQQHERIAQGADAYRKGDFAAAEKAFTGIETVDALYNQGNALAKLGRYDQAIAAYDQALKLQPNMEDAIENRKVVDAARKRKNQSNDGKNPQDGQGDQQKEKPSGNEGQGSPQPGNKPSAPGKDPKQSPPASDKPGEKPGPGASPQQQAADAKAQEAADAAQRKRMEQAMGKEGKEASDKPSAAQPQGAARTETPQQREQRQAVEAWLRRVPDEPGGLLKTKFRLEYERRQKEGP
ncbi:MAG: tetratricopeptide repeat protein [Pseudoxanthomonas sp.]